MHRFFAFALLTVCFTIATTGCGSQAETKVVQPETTQTDEELEEIHAEREAAMDSSNLAE